MTHLTPLNTRKVQGTGPELLANCELPHTLRFSYFLSFRYCEALSYTGLFLELSLSKSGGVHDKLKLHISIAVHTGAQDLLLSLTLANKKYNSFQSPRAGLHDTTASLQRGDADVI